MTTPEQQLEAARIAKDELKSLLRNVSEVSGIGITQVNDRYAVKVNLEQPIEDAAIIPADVNGVPVVVHTVGVISKQG